MPLKPNAELFENNRLVVWDIEQSRILYNTGFYGKPLGTPRPKEDFDTPLLLDPVEALYLLEKKIISVQKGKTSLSKKRLRNIAEKTFTGFKDKYRVYQDLRNKGYVVTPGIKYGCDFAVYENGPGLDHAPYIIQLMNSNMELSAAEIVKAGRLATTVRKAFMLAIVDEEIRYLEFKWWKA